MAQNAFCSWRDWNVVKKLGKGSFGSVYQIERPIIGTNKIEYAALKVLSIPQENGEIDDLAEQGYGLPDITAHYSKQRDEIMHEYNIMLNLKGETNIVSCDEVQWESQENGIGWHIYIRMELLNPLHKAIGNTYDEKNIIKLGKDICRALICCKKENIIHRDIKPQNILVSSSGDFKLADFGVAKVSEKTASGTITGTYEYMAPEVFRAKEYNASVDIYSLGLVMYSLMNNKRTPFLPQNKIPTVTEAEAARSRRFSGQNIPAPIHGCDALKKIVLKACSYNPSDRYHSPQEMLMALESIRIHEIPDTSSSDAWIAQDCVHQPTQRLNPEEATVLEGGTAKPVSVSTPVKNEKFVEKKPSKQTLSMITAVAIAVILCIIICFRVLDPAPVEQLPEHTVSSVPPLSPETVPVVTEAPQTIPAVTEVPQTIPAVTEVPQTIPVFAEEAADNADLWMDNILRRDTIGSESTPAFNSGVKKSQIHTVTFLDTFQGAPITSIDVSKAYDGSVKAWFIGNGEIYDMFIAGEGGVNGIEACQELFIDYTNLKKVQFGGNFHTETTQIMTSMFQNCKSLKEVDLETLDTSAVTAMNCMFDNCESLEALDLSTFDTSSVTNMAAMFEGCCSLTDLNLTGLRTDNVTAMHYMFYNCAALEALDLSGFNTSAVMKMAFMFKNCTSLKHLDISSFDTGNVELFEEMFLNCPNLTDLDVSHFDTSSATDYYYFMDEGREVAGRPWRELFE